MATKTQLRNCLLRIEEGFSIQEAKVAAGISPGEQLYLPSFPPVTEVEKALKSPLEAYEAYHDGYAVLKSLNLPWPSFVCQIIKQSCHVDNSAGPQKKIIFRRDEYLSRVIELGLIFYSDT